MEKRRWIILAVYRALRRLPSAIAAERAALRWQYVHEELTRSLERDAAHVHEGPAWKIYEMPDKRLLVVSDFHPGFVMPLSREEAEDFYGFEPRVLRARQRATRP